jgi:hypothetical protein
MTRVEINSKIILTCSDDLSTEEDLRDMVLFTEVMLNQMDLQKLGSNKE